MSGQLGSQSRATSMREDNGSRGACANEQQPRSSALQRANVSTGAGPRAACGTLHRMRHAPMRHVPRDAAAAATQAHSAQSHARTRLPSIHRPSAASWQLAVMGNQQSAKATGAVIGRSTGTAARGRKRTPRWKACPARPIGCRSTKNALQRPALQGVFEFTHAHAGAAI